MKGEYFSFYFDENTGIFYKNYYGGISLAKIRASWNYVFDQHSIPSSVVGIIIDYRKAHFDMPPSEHVEIANFYHDHLDVFGSLKVGVVVADAKDFVIPTLVEGKSDGFISKTFSTIEAAKAWVVF